METKVRCVSYADEFSISKSSLKDLEIGHEHRMVGCNSKVFGASKRNDFVIITATHNRKRYAIIGLLKDKLDSCDLWHRHGGHLWKYNYTYVSLTEIFEVTNQIKEKIAEFCLEEPKKPNPVQMMNSRLCGIRYKNVVLKLVNFLNDQ